MVWAVFILIAKQDIWYKITPIPFYVLNLIFHLLHAALFPPQFELNPLFAIFTVHIEKKIIFLKKKFFIQTNLNH